jgi:hypothetical protein
MPLQPVIPLGTVWMLHRDGTVATAEVQEIRNVGVELRYCWGGNLMVSRLFRDGTDLLKEAREKQFDLEGRGWRSSLVSESARADRTN